MKNIPYAKQEITEADLSAVSKVLLSDLITQGPLVAEFEKQFANYVGSKYAIAVSNGTTALHLAALALNVGTGKKVLTTPITFAASANSILYCGGDVEFADIDANSFCIDYEKLKIKLESSPKGTYSGLVLVDLAGYPLNLQKFRELADEHGLWIIEDACHALGGAFKDNQGHWQKCGSSQFADISTFSFHPVKHITCGEGGMITTNNLELYKKMQLMRVHGITKNPDEMIDFQGGWYYEMQELGYNYKLPDILCALGLSQLNRAEENLKKRRAIAARYDRELTGLNLVLPKVAEGLQHAYHLYVVRTDKRKQLYDYLKTKGINTQVHYIPISDMPYYKKLGHNSSLTPVAKKYYERCLSIPMYPSLTDEEQTYVIQMIRDFFS